MESTDVAAEPTRREGRRQRRGCSSPPARGTSLVGSSGGSRGSHRCCRTVQCAGVAGGMHGGGIYEAIREAASPRPGGRYPATRRARGDRHRAAVPTTFANRRGSRRPHRRCPTPRRGYRLQPATGLLSAALSPTTVTAVEAVAAPTRSTRYRAAGNPMEPARTDQPRKTSIRRGRNRTDRRRRPQPEGAATDRMPERRDPASNFSPTFSVRNSARM